MSPQPSPSNHTPTDALLTQLCIGPSFREVASVLLRQSLQERYPNLDIDPDIAMVGTPAWDLIDNEIVAGPPAQQHLSDILAEQAVSGIPALYIEGVHYLTQQKNTHPTTHIPVRINEIANLINVLAPVMLTAFQEQQVAYWNANNGNAEPHWKALSDTLRDIWNVTEVEGWTWEECNMAFTLWRSPELKSRQDNDAYDANAYLIDVDTVDGETVKHWGILSIAVLTGTIEGKSVILTYSLLNGYQKFTSMEQLSQNLPSYVNIHAPNEIQWRLFEPNGHFFDHQSCTLISQQLAFIGNIDLLQARHRAPDESSLNIPPPPQELVNQKQPDLQRYIDAEPWLVSASATDLSLYARYLKDLSALHTLNVGKHYDDGVPHIWQYTLDRLRTEILKEHPEAADLNLESVEIRVFSPFAWDTFALTGRLETTVYSLPYYALQNLTGVTVYTKSIHLPYGKPLPGWLTLPYIETLISRVDVGKNYPALAKSKLLDNASESTRRQALFSSHLRIQLPLLALQYKMRAQAGIDELGYRYVAAVLAPEATDRKVDGLTILLRPLAFAPVFTATARHDVVTNMFVIGPQDLNAGPCLLYRPMFDQQLIQYASPADLLYGIRQSPELRSSVLAWLPDSVRDDYAHYAFPGELPSPWIIVDAVLVPAPLKLLAMSGPMELGTQALTGDLCSALYNANANALITLANRQSVSNAEARWATFQQAGWLLLSAVLPFLGQEVNAALWIWQILDQLQEAVDEQQQPRDKEDDTWPAWAKLLLNLGMALTLHLATRTQPSRNRLIEEAPAVPQPVEPPTIKKPATARQVANLTEDALPSDPPHELHTLGAFNRHEGDLERVLRTFKIDKPAVTSKASKQPGVRQHLYELDGKWYASVKRYNPDEEYWFQVTVDAYDNVQINDSEQFTRKGPLLQNNSRGEWFIDTQLRLRGGGLKNRVNAANAVAELEAAALDVRLKDFNQQIKSSQTLLQKTYETMRDAPNSSAQRTRDAFFELLKSQRAGYETALQNLKELNVFAPTHDYLKNALRYIRAQLGLSLTELHETLKVVTPQLKTSLDNMDRQFENPQTRHIADARKMTGIMSEVITHLDYFQTRFDELRGLSREGMALIKSARSYLPSYDSDTLKALQFKLARNLCLHENTTHSSPLAWTAIDQIVDAGEIAIQALLDTLSERSVSRTDECIESLSSLFEQFTVLDERVQDLPGEFPGITLAEPLTDLRQRLSEYKQRAANHLVLLSNERRVIRATPRLPSTPPRPGKKFIRTRYNGMVVGEPQLNELREETGKVEVREPMSGKVVAVFHEKEPGLWLKEHKRPPATSAPIDLQSAIDTGRELLDALPAFQQRITTLADQPQRTPIGIEYLYHQHIQRLEQAKGSIEQALKQGKPAQNVVSLASSVKGLLGTATDTLNQQAREHVTRLTKQRPPTPSVMQWLKDRNLITIEKTQKRRRIKSPTPDYLDEYTISEVGTKTVLWYAHFHYSADWTTPRSFVSARLKTPTEKGLGSAADTTSGLTSEERLAFYRSEISEGQAKTLFFPPERNW